MTAKASVDVKAAVNVGKDAVAVKSGSEKGGVVTEGPDGKLAVIPEKGKTGDLTATISVDKLHDVAGMHGHPDNANGMVDDPSKNGGLGDTSSLILKNPIPMATVYKGQVGWHELDNGRLQFSAPKDSMTSTQMDQIQRNLNVEQKLFQ